MIPTWLYETMVKNRTSSAMTHDEHGRPLEEIADSKVVNNKRAHVGYKEFPRTYETVEYQK